MRKLNTSRARKHRKRQRRQSDGWRQTMKRQNDLGGAGWQPNPTQEVNPQIAAERITDDTERTEPSI
jgi:hypothetical protein